MAGSGAGGANEFAATNTRSPPSRTTGFGVGSRTVRAAGPCGKGSSTEGGEMRGRPYTQLFVHLVWATWDRAPLLDAELMQVVDAAIRRECVEMGVDVIAIGGVADHIHLLVRFPTTISVADLVKQVKRIHLP